MRGGRFGVVVLVALGALACGGRGPRVLPRNVRQSVHRDHPECGGREIRGYDLGGGRYQVLACGMDVVYACPTGPHSRWRSCVPEQTAGGYVVAMQPGAVPAQGGVIVVTAGTPGGEMAYPATATTPQPVQAAAAPAATTAVPTLEQIEAGVGQWIDTHRAEILACTGTPAALVEVTWDAAGTPTVQLGGEMHGSAGEPCVVGVLSGVQLNVGGQAGTVRHVVQ